jgi:hypothetical protein
MVNNGGHMKKHPYLNSYIRGINMPRYQRELGASIALKAGFFEDAYLVDNVPHWKTGNRIPPKDILEFWHYCGLPFDFEKATIEREAETDRFLTEYRARMANYVPSDEEAFEMRAAFGPGEIVVNVITGQRFST